MDFLIAVLDLFILPFGLMVFIEYIQKLFAGNNVLIFGRTYDFLSIIICLSLMFICNIFDHLKDLFNRIVFIISILVLLWASSQYYYVTSQGVTTHALLEKKFHPWSQLIEVKLEMKYQRGFGRMQYILFFMDDAIDINDSNLWGSSNGVMKVHQIIRQKKIPVIKGDFQEKDYNELSPWETEVVNGEI